MNEYVLNNVITFRVPTVEDALSLRDRLQNINCGELVNFAYTTKVIKVKGEVVDEFQIVKAKIKFNEEKEPESQINLEFNGEEI